MEEQAESSGHMTEKDLSINLLKKKKKKDSVMPEVVSP